MDEIAACLALRHSKGIGPRTWKRLLDTCGSAAAAIADAATWTLRGLTNAGQQREFLLGRWRDKAEAERADAERLGFVAITYGDPSYPERLRQIPDPPVLLYVLGDPDLLARPAVAVVGSRQASRYGLSMAGSIAASLSRAGVCVVSGFALGIDRAAHVGALDGIGGTIAVLGTGLDIVYPAANRDLWQRMAAHGLLVTEFAPGIRPEGGNFPHRNRIVSGLALGVLVVEAALNSGSLITADLALSQNREVFALPGPANLNTFKGCHQLIRQGACLVQSADDILHELQPVLRVESDGHAPAKASTVPEPDDPDQRALFRLLAAGGQVHVDDLARRTAWPADRISSVLLFMELQGLVKQHPGMYYTLSI